MYWDEASQTYKLRLKLIHTTPAMQQNFVFESRYDLVQAAPLSFPSPVGLVSEQSVLPQADTNADGVVNEADWDTFVESWLTDEASADLNLNSEIDTEDADLFVEAYVNGG